MLVLLTVATLAIAQDAASDEAFLETAKTQARQLLDQELLGHYDVADVAVVVVEEHTGAWGGYRNGYGLRTVTVEFVTLRNSHWSPQLNRRVLCDEPGSAPHLLLCRPSGHRFSGTMTVDLAFTIAGWQVLSRNFRNRRQFPLSGYLELDGKKKEGYVLSPE
jgi:hypothetical protein